MSKRQTICVDFDGVIHSYESRWVNAHTIPDAPVDGAIEWLIDMLAEFDVYILSTRCKTWRGRWAMTRWLRKHSGSLWNECMLGRGIEDVKLTYEKVPALLYVDDRGWHFTGTFPTTDEIREFKPWNKP